jgi:TM2 domain-containing membrane protein YozV/cold shock CspA family protein
MRGKILSFDDYTGSGLISGDDGGRYTFTRGGLMGGTGDIPAGSDVDFEVADGVATNIYVTASSRPVASSSDKNKIVAALLAFFLGTLGIHKFYLGKTTAGIIMLVCGTIGWLLILPGFIMAIIAFIEFIIYLVKSDEEFHRDYVVGNKSWF